MAVLHGLRRRGSPLRVIEEAAGPAALAGHDAQGSQVTVAPKSRAALSSTSELVNTLNTPNRYDRTYLSQPNFFK